MIFAQIIIDDPDEDWAVERTDGDHWGYYQFRRKLTAGYVVLFALLLGLLAWKVSEAHRASREADLAMTRMVAKSMAAHVAELIDSVKSTLDKSAREIAALPPEQMTSSKISALLAATMGSANARFWLVYVDRRGRGVTSSAGPTIEGTPFKHQPFFDALDDESSPDYFFGAPEMDRTSGRPVFYMSRRVVSDDGAFQGVLAAPIDAAKVAGVFELALLNAKMSITMAATDKKSSRGRRCSPRLSGSTLARPWANLGR